MKNLKKLLAVLVVVAMMATLIVPAFAEGEVPADGQIAADLGLLVGDGNGVDATYLAKSTTRLQAAIITLRLMGKQADALAYTGETNFTDGNIDWAGGKAIMGYLKANPDLGWAGNPDGSFTPNTIATAQMMYKVILEALGYKAGTDFTWEQTLSFAASKGLIKILDKAELTNADLATALVEALKVNLKDGSKTLAAKLVETGVMDEDAAIAAGVYTKPVVKFEATKVIADNYKEIVIEFSKALDEDTAEEIGNYKFDDASFDDDEDGTTVDVNDDGKSVTITLSDEDIFEDNQTDFEITIDGVKSTDGDEISDQAIEGTMDDQKAPVAESIELTGPNKFKIIFSEPLDPDTEGTVEIDDGDITVDSDEADGSNELVVELTDDKLSEGDYKVEVTDYRDYAGFKMAKKEFTLKYVIDKTPPTAEIVSATENKVVVKFNEEVFNGDSTVEIGADDVEYFYHTSDGNYPDEVENDSNKEFTLRFIEDPLPVGSVKFIVVAEPDDYDPITDAWGNELTANIRLTATVAEDNDKPTVKKVEMGDNNKEILVYFSEDVDTDDAEDIDNYLVKDDDGDEVEIYDATYERDGSDYIATIEMLDELDSGDYTVKVSGIHDTSSEENEMEAVTKTVSIDDEDGPDMDDAVVYSSSDNSNGEYIYVVFPEDMATSGTYSVLDKDKYFIEDTFDHDNNPATPEVVERFELRSYDKIETVGGKDMIKITYNWVKDDDDDTRTIEHFDGNENLVIMRVADAEGNKSVVGNSNPASVTKSVTVGEPAPLVTEVSAQDEKTIKVVVGGKLKTVASSAVQIVKGGTTYTATVKSWEYDDGETEITVTLPKACYFDSSAPADIQAFDVKVVANKMKTAIGTAVVAVTIPAANIVDEYGPSIADDDADYVTSYYAANGYTQAQAKAKNAIDIYDQAEGQFLIFFNEELKTANGIDAKIVNDLIITETDGDKVSPSDYSTAVVTVGGISFILVDLDDDLVAGTNVSYYVKSKDSLDYIKDLADNEGEAFTDRVKLTFRNAP